MKKFILKFSLITVLVATLSSCEEDKVVFNGSGSNSLASFATNKGGLAVVDENSSTTIVVNVADLSDVDRSIVLSVDEESTALPSEYEIDATTLVVPANSYQGEIVIKANYDALVTGVTKKLILKLDSVGEAFTSPTSYTLSIFKSCDFDPSSLGTDYTSTVFIEGDFVLEYNPVITQSPTNPNVFTFTSLWSPSFVAVATGDPQYENQYLYPGTMTINSDFTLTITTTAGYGGESTGTFDPCTNTFNYSLVQELFSGDFTVDVTMVPNN